MHSLSLTKRGVLRIETYVDFSTLDFVKINKKYFDSETKEQIQENFKFQ